jgi:hypothetical protein
VELFDQLGWVRSAGSSDMSLSGPDTNATTLRDTERADHSNVSENHSLDTKRLRYGRGTIREPLACWIHLLWGTSDGARR